MKRVFIIHGWGGFPHEAWMPWLKNKLEEKGIEVHVPAMPDTDTPKIDAWVSHLAQAVGQPDAETYFIGHSMGVQTIFRYLESINTQIGGVLAVAGFYTLLDATYENEEERQIAKPWLETPIDNKKARKNANKITAIFSDNDPYVGLDNVGLFKEYLGAKTVVLENKGHLNEGGGYKEVEEVWVEVENLIK